jgi:hypothetical protein
MGKPGRPKKEGAATVALTTKVSVEENARLEAFLAVKNERARAEGYGLVTVSAHMRRVLLASLDAAPVGEGHAPLPPLTEDTLKQAWDRAVELALAQGEDVEKLLADAARNVDAWRAHNGSGPVGADEVVTSQPTHRKRVRAVVPSELPPPVPEPPPEAGQQDAAEWAPEGEDDLVDAEALLRGTPL